MGTPGTGEGVHSGLPFRIHHVSFYESFHPPARDLTLDDNLPDLAHPRNNDTSHQPPTADLGALERLPLELLHMTVAHLDLGSLENFRRVNRRASDVVESYLPYKELKTHVPNMLRGALYIEAGRWISCQTVYEKLRTRKCDRRGCVNIGTYFHILACERLCHRCLVYDFPNFRYIPTTPSLASYIFGLDQEVIDKLPAVRGRPGTYGSEGCPGGHDEWVMNESMVLVDRKAAYDAAVALHGSDDAVRTYIESVWVRSLPKADATIDVPTISRLWRALKALPFAVTVRMPW